MPQGQKKSGETPTVELALKAAADRASECESTSAGPQSSRYTQHIAVATVEDF